MSNSTSIGRGPAHGSNENHDGDPRHTTMGESASQEDPPVGSELDDAAAPDATAPRAPEPGSPRGIPPKP